MRENVNYTQFIIILLHLEQDKIMPALSKPASLAVKCHTPGYVQCTPYDPYLDYSICKLYHVGYIVSCEKPKKVVTALNFIGSFFFFLRSFNVRLSSI